MFKPHATNAAQRTALLFLFVCLSLAGTRTTIYAQQSPAVTLATTSTATARGLELYNQGNFKEAINALKQASQQQRTDATAWHFLGLAYQQTGDLKNAQKALETALYLRFAQFAPNSFGVDGKQFADLNKDERAVFLAEQVRRYRAALPTLEAYLQLNPPDAALWREQAESLKFYIEHTEATDSEPYIATLTDGLTRAAITFKREPEFSAEARRYNITGEVTLRMVLAADGTVQHILVVKPLPYGLIEQCIEAARAMRFNPAIKDGRPVAQYTSVTYHFYIY
ncbi:MAG TPA: TonB family protein [Pyrinomonadaceae bacterium]|jgi:TonB family protein